MIHVVGFARTSNETLKNWMIFPYQGMALCTAFTQITASVSFKNIHIKFQFISILSVFLTIVTIPYFFSKKNDFSLWKSPEGLLPDMKIQCCCYIYIYLLWAWGNLKGIFSGQTAGQLKKEGIGFWYKIDFTRSEVSIHKMQFEPICMMVWNSFKS